MSVDLQTRLFEDVTITTKEEYIEAIKNKSITTVSNNTFRLFTPQPINRYEWVFQFGDSTPVTFFTTHQDMLNPDGTLTITCTPSNVTHLEFRYEENSFKIYSRALD